MSTRRLLPLLLVALAVLLAACGDDEQAGQTQQVQTGAQGRTVQIEDGGQGGSLARVPEIYRTLEPSVVAVLAEGPRGSGEGSGVVFQEDVIVTNAHVVQQAENLQVAVASGERIDAEVIATDRLTDLAVLRVKGDASLPPAAFAEQLPQVGSLAVAMGNPLGFENTVTAGIVSGLDRSIPSGGRTPALVGLIQTDAAISPGNSGGALVGENGQVIGINVAFIPPQARAVAIGFAIPAPTVVDVVRELLADGEVEHAYLGVVLRPLTPEVAQALGTEVEQGAVVASLQPGGPAAEAGLRPGDVITQIGDREVQRVEDVYAALRDLDPNDQVQVTVIRNGERRTVEVEVAERPQQIRQ